jgi:hypothetical protein
LAYFDAWTHKDLDRAMTYIAENILCGTPAGRVGGAGAYRAFMAPFRQLLTNATIIAAFGNDQTAMLMYDTKPFRCDPCPARSGSPSNTARAPAAGSCSTGLHSRRRTTSPRARRSGSGSRWLAFSPYHDGAVEFTGSSFETYPRVVVRVTDRHAQAADGGR